MVEVLLKDEPCHQRGSRTLKRQKQGGRSSSRPSEPRHQKKGPKYPAGHDGARKPGHILPLERNLRDSRLDQAEPDATQDGDTKAGAAVEQAGSILGSTLPSSALAAGVERPKRAAERRARTTA